MSIWSLRLWLRAANPDGWIELNRHVSKSTRNTILTCVLLLRPDRVEDIISAVIPEAGVSYHYSMVLTVLYLAESAHPLTFRL